MDEQESIIVEHIEPLAACVEVEELFRRNMPTVAPKHAAGNIVLWTSARSHRTFKVMVKTCKLGYALEAAKLNRALFEDMVYAHWATSYPEDAGRLIAEHARYVHVLRAEAYAAHGLAFPSSAPPHLTEQERSTFAKRYGRYGVRGWTGKSMKTMVDNIAAMWPQGDRRLLNQMYDIAHQANNVIVHHSFASLSQGVQPTADGFVLDVKPSGRGVGSALAFGLWAYANTISLVLDSAPLVELNKLMVRYAQLFSTVRSAGEAE